MVPLGHCLWYRHKQAVTCRFRGRRRLLAALPAVSLLLLAVVAGSALQLHGSGFVGHVFRCNILGRSRIKLLSRHADGISAASAELARPAVHVVDGHGDVMERWESLPGEAYRVLHIDSHADMFLDFKPKRSPAPSASRIEVWNELRQQVHLSNFIPLSIFGGKVGTVVWLRSDFPDCRYNGPPPGSYELKVGAPDVVHGEGPALCYWQQSGSSFRDYNFMADPLRGGYDIMGEKDAWPPREHNRWWEKVPYLLDEFGLYLLGEPLGTPFAPPAVGQGGATLDAPFNFSVLTDTQAGANVDSAASLLARQLGGGPGWILDVDLDFFATLAPDLALIVRRLQLKPDAATSLGKWTQEFAVAVQVLEEEDPSCSAFRLPLLMETIRSLRAVAASRDTVAVTPAAVEAVIREADMQCGVVFDAAEHLATTLSRLTLNDLDTWDMLTPDEWDAVIASPHGPHHVGSRADIQHSMGRLETLFQSLCDQGLPPPTMVTVARSTDLYLPLDLGPFVEEEMLSVLSRLGWSGGSSSSVGADAPPWPDQAAVPVDTGDNGRIAEASVASVPVPV